MLFCSQAFFLFFIAVFAVYWLLPWPRGRVWLLLAASFYFYATWSRWLALLVCGSTVIDYTIARVLERSTSPRLRKALTTLSIAANLALLAYFKYANFFLGSLDQLLASAGVRVGFPVVHVLVPIGISFYTFEAISYVVDVYARRIRAERSLPNFMLFILFFPHLMAGPIVRARDFLPQVGRRKHWQPARIELGACYVLLGMFKKLAIADRMAFYSDAVFAQPTIYSSAAAWMATIAYALQVYCDFSGYSDMAIGTAHLLGYKLAPNFNLPYMAANISEFWRRWHISLSSWLRDYLFIPLGGSRRGAWRTDRNLLIVMTLGGLWHGANWPFVAFGCLHGFWLILHRRFRSWSQNRRRLDYLLGSGPGTAVRIASTFFCFCMTLVVFRSATFRDAGYMFDHLFRARTGAQVPLDPAGFWCTLLLVAVCQLFAFNGRWPSIWRRLPAPVFGCGCAAMLIAAIMLAPPAGKAFIYFQF
jgi:alginate O-acetyltransferase complex protein AlgI